MYFEKLSILRYFQKLQLKANYFLYKSVPILYNAVTLFNKKNITIRKLFYSCFSVVNNICINNISLENLRLKVFNEYNENRIIRVE